jgi:hypothetical protein
MWNLGHPKGNLPAAPKTEAEDKAQERAAFV